MAYRIKAMVVEADIMNKTRDVVYDDANNQLVIKDVSLDEVMPLVALIDSAASPGKTVVETEAAKSKGKRKPAGSRRKQSKKPTPPPEPEVVAESDDDEPEVVAGAGTAAEPTVMTPRQDASDADEEPLDDEPGDGSAAAPVSVTPREEPKKKTTRKRKKRKAEPEPEPEMSADPGEDETEEAEPEPANEPAIEVVDKTQSNVQRVDSEEVDEGLDDAILEQVKDAKRIYNVVTVFIDNGIKTREELRSACMAYRPHVRALKDIPEASLPSRLDSVLELAAADID